MPGIVSCLVSRIFYLPDGGQTAYPYCLTLMAPYFSTQVFSAFTFPLFIILFIIWATISVWELLKVLTLKTCPRTRNNYCHIFNQSLVLFMYSDFSLWMLLTCLVSKSSFSSHVFWSIAQGGKFKHLAKLLRNLIFFSSGMLWVEVGGWKNIVFELMLVKECTIHAKKI